MDVEFLKENGFSQDQIAKISEPDFIVIRNFYNYQEIINSDKNQVITAAKMLASIFSDLEIVDMFDYVNQHKKSPDQRVPENKKEIEVSPFPVTAPITEPVEIDLIDSFNDNTENTADDFRRFVVNRYIVQQVWILEYLINNPNLLINDNPEQVKLYLQRKEIELKLHKSILQKFFGTIQEVGNIHVVINFKHFETIKKDLAIRLIEFQKNPPLNFQGVVEILQTFGFEDQEDLNIGICSVLAELIKDPKVQKLIKYTEKNFHEVDLNIEKKKLLRKVFKEPSTPGT